MSSTNASTSGARAVVLGEAADGGEAPRYAMFGLDELSAEGAFLASALLLEVGEEIRLELSAPGADAVVVRARVIEHRTDSRPGMRVTFRDTGAGEILAALATP